MATALRAQRCTGRQTKSPEAAQEGLFKAINLCCDILCFTPIVLASDGPTQGGISVCVREASLELQRRAVVTGWFCFALDVGFAGLHRG